MKNIQRLSISGLALLLLLAGCRSSKDDNAAEPVQVLSPTTLHVSADALGNLKFAQAQLTDFPEILSVMGKVSPTEDRIYVVPARAAGRIESVAIASGETAKPGQVLGTIFSPDFVAAREEYLQSVHQAGRESDAGGGHGDFHGLAKLARKKLESLGLSAQDIDRLGTTDDKSDVEPNLIVRAPRSGAVITKNAIVGNQVNQGDPLFMIADLHKVWFLGDLYPEDLRKVKKDQEVVVDSGTGQSLHGKVSFISPVVDPTTRTIKIRALIDNPDLTLRADMYLQGGLVMSHQSAILIPSKAIFRDNNSQYVFKVNGALNIEGGHASGADLQKVEVATAGERQGSSAVTSGLKSGDQVVSDGALLLNAALTNPEK